MRVSSVIMPFTDAILTSEGAEVIVEDVAGVIGAEADNDVME